MLAQTFKSHKDLHISEKMYDALVKVYWLLVDETIPEQLFCMGTIGQPKMVKGSPCGTAGCLLGWARTIEPALHNGAHYDAGFRSGNLGKLFYPLVAGKRGHAQLDANRGLAVKALHNYLTTGKADWRGVMNG